jgi:glycosyltransferase involved in cell wall biosynthesis
VHSRHTAHISYPKRIGLYDTYLATLGGGENFLAVFAEALEDEFPAADLDILTHEEGDVSIEKLANRFGVTLNRTNIRRIPTKSRGHLKFARPLRRFLHEQDVSEISSTYDLFVNNTVYSLAPTLARHSIYVCMFPLTPEPWKLRDHKIRRRVYAPYIGLRRRLYRKWIGSYDLVVANSEFTRRWIRRLWRLDSEVLYPPIETKPQLPGDGRRNYILAIGRFFPGNHNKKHDVLIKAFRRLERAGLKGWQLHLVGGRTDIPGTDEYISGLKALARGGSVFFHFDAPRDDLERLLTSSSIFWHATGYGEDQQAEPEKLEHFGMSTVEAMTNGCVPLVFRCGGQPEIVEDGVSGCLWDSTEELENMTLRLAHDSEARVSMAKAAHKRSQFFSRDEFRRRTQRVLSSAFQGSST